ncbi:MAG: stage III sporulation protein AF [Defluviitaleaceae bacterium]|nr:stage III sporulation protein AF [Defluviitaleaceae bacterium]
MSYINDYVRNIAFFLIFASFAGIILPEGKYKKYINVVLGLVLIVILLSPFYRFLSTGNFDVDELIDSLNISSAFASDVSQYEEMRNRAITSEFLTSLRAYTENLLLESNFVLTDLSADFDINTGTIMSMHLTVKERESPPGEPNSDQNRRPFIRIEPIRINNFAARNVESQEITDMKIMISNFYGVDVDNIYIEVQEMR